MKEEILFCFLCAGKVAVGPKGYRNFDRFHTGKIRSLLSCKRSSFFSFSKARYG